jgi:hypothetical protein
MVVLQEIRACASNPCQSGGTCVELAGGGGGGAGYRCECVEGTSGENCAVNLDDCAGVLCEVAGAHCVDGLNEHFCRCRPGYTGEGVQCKQECAERTETIVYICKTYPR